MTLTPASAYSALGFQARTAMVNNTMETQSPRGQNDVTRSKLKDRLTQAISSEPAIANLDSAGLAAYLDPEVFADKLNVPLSNSPWSPSATTSRGSTAARGNVRANVPAARSSVQHPRRSGDSPRAGGAGARWAMRGVSNPAPVAPAWPKPTASAPRWPRSAHAPDLESMLAPISVSDVRQTFRYAGRDITYGVPPKLDDGLRQLAFISTLENSVDRMQAWDEMPISVREQVRLYKRAQRDMLHGDQTLSDDEVRRNLHVVSSCGDSCESGDTITLSQMYESELVAAVDARMIQMDKERRPQSPAEFLYAVSRARQRSRVPLLDENGHLNRNVDALLLNASKTLYREWQLAERPDDGGIDTELSNGAFIDMLNTDMAKFQLAGKFIPVAAPDYEYSSFWFDGLAIRGAVGMSIDDIALQIRGDMPFDEKLALTKLRFRQLGESTRFIVGTPPHSYATMILRVGPALGISSGGLTDAASLMARFNELIDANAGPNSYPVSPLLLSAHHLARTAGVLSSRTLDNEALLTRELCTSKLYRMASLTRAGLQRRDDSIVMHDADQHATPFECEKVAVMARADHSLTGTVAEKEAVAQYHALQASRELITAESAEEFNRKTMAYLNERWAAYEPIPQFDEVSAAEGLLRERLGVSLGDMYRSRPFDINTLDIQRVPKQMRTISAEGTPLDEFLMRSEMADPLAQEFKIGSRSLNTAAALKGERARFSDALPLHPIMLTKAKEELRLAGLPRDQPRILHVAQLIARSIIDPVDAGDQLSTYLYEQLAALHGASMDDQAAAKSEQIYMARSRADRSGAAPLPVLDAGYAIDRTLLHGDWAQIVDGVAPTSWGGLLQRVREFPDPEIAADFEQRLTEVQPSAPISPAVSMLRDFYTQTKTTSLSVFPLGIEGAISDPRSFRHIEFAYADENSGATLTLGRVRAPTKPDGYPAVGTMPVEHSVSLQAARNIMEAIAEAELATIPIRSAYGVTTSLPVARTGSKSAPPIAQINDVFQATDIGMRATTEHMLALVNRSPLARRLVRFGVARNTLPLTPQPYTSVLVQLLLATARFGGDEHACLEADSATVKIFLDRILYEANVAVPNIARVDSIAASVHLALWERLARLMEDQKLDGYFNNAHEPNLKILGTPAKQRKTIIAAEHVRRALSEARVWQGHGGARDALLRDGLTWRTTPGAWSAQTEALRAAFTEHLDKNSSFDSMVSRWLESEKDSGPWTITLGAPRPSTKSEAPWHIDRSARSVDIFAARVYYPTPRGPALLSHKRCVVGAFLEAIYGDVQAPLSAEEASLNRGFYPLMTNALFDSEPSARAVSAEFAVNAWELLDTNRRAVWAAEEEDSIIRSEHRLNVAKQPALLPRNRWTEA
jgi:hypothetical protein